MAFQPDTATVVAARAGDPAAVDRLVAGYLPLVYTIVGRALDGHADSDDVVQDVMLRVLRNLGDLRDPEAFRSWRSPAWNFPGSGGRPPRRPGGWTMTTANSCHSGGWRPPAS